MVSNCKSFQCFCRVISVTSVLWLLLAGLVACAPPATPLPTAVPTAFIPPPPLARTSAAPPATASPAVWHISLAADVPAAAATAVADWVAQQPNFAIATGSDGDVQLTTSGGAPLGDWVLAVAAPFATVDDAMSLAALQAHWRGEQADFSLLLTPDVAAWLTAQWGAPGQTVQQVDAATLVDALWAQRPSLTVLPFAALTPRLKVLALDGVSPLAASFDPASYPLTLPLGATGDETAVAALRAQLAPLTNRDPQKLTRVAMTGVTALVRATANQMEIQGVAYPGTAVAEVLQTADIAHVSNEVSFAADCPTPNPIGGTTFCSRDSYFELLTMLGVDVVELTGNHVNDWGHEALLRSLGMYAEAGMVTFGGGATLAEAAQPAIITHHGNAIAFVGCNPVGPAYAWATDSTPGSRPCGAAFAAQIAQLAADGYVVLATQQYQEYYFYEATAVQQQDFAALAAAGATAVSGSQGHHAQGFDFAGDAFIHYGLGNLFFDQMDQMGTRQTFVDTYVIYDGRLLSVELWTGLIENYARPRLMTDEERQEVLTAVFGASGW